MLTRRALALQMRAPNPRAASCRRASCATRTRAPRTRARTGRKTMENEIVRAVHDVVKNAGPCAERPGGDGLDDDRNLSRACDRAAHRVLRRSRASGWS